MSDRRNLEYDYGNLRTGVFPHGWGIGALHAHIHDPGVTPDGKGRAQAEIDARAERRARNRGLCW